MSEPYRPPGSREATGGIGRGARIVIALVALGVVAAIVGIGIGVNVIADRLDDSARAAEGTTGESESGDAAEPDDAEDGPAGSDAGRQKLTAEEVFSGSDDERIEATLDGHTVHARRVGRHEHADCAGAGGATVSAVLREHGCTHRVEQALAGESGAYWVGNQVLAFPDERSARTAGEELDAGRVAFDFAQYDRARDGDRFRHVATADVSKRFLVVSTLVVDGEDPGVSEKDVEDDMETLYGFLHAELRNYFVWR